jgi:hypothetical protein
MATVCHTCARPLDVAVDPMSVDCGGDCWGCIGLFEAEMGGASPEDDVRFAKEISLGWRDSEGCPKPQTFFIANPGTALPPE